MRRDQLSESKSNEIYIEHLDVTMNKNEMLKKPFFFLPREGENHNIMTDTIEPYTGIMRESIKGYYNFNPNASMRNFIDYQMNLYRDIMTTNANIIFENGLLHFLEPFLTVPVGEIYKIWNDKKFYHMQGYSEVELSKCIDQDGNYIYEPIASFVSNCRLNTTRSYTNIYYQVINYIMMSGMVDINKFGEYIKHESNITTDVSRSYMSLCIQCALELANYDISKIAEYVDLLGFYVMNNMLCFYIQNKNRFDELINKRRRAIESYEDIDF